MHVRLVSKHLDSVYFEAVGTKQMSNGERMGYHVMHSLVLDKAPPIPTYDRFNFSLCILWRQKSPQRVQSFMTMYIEINESFVTPFVVKSMADALVGIWKYTECAQLKKLAWLVRRKRMISETGDDGRCTKVEDGCSVCGSHSRSARKGIKSACAACGKYTCKRCATKRELSIFAPDGQLIKYPMRFCLPCMTVVNKLDAAVIAQDDISSGTSVVKRGGYREGTSLGLTPSRSHASSESSLVSDSSHHSHSAWTSAATTKPSHGSSAVKRTGGIIV